MGSNLCTADWSESTTDHVKPSKEVDRERIIISIFSMLDNEKTGRVDLKSAQAQFDKQSNLGSEFWTSVLGMCNQAGIVTKEEFVDLYNTSSKTDNDIVFREQANKFIELVSSLPIELSEEAAVSPKHGLTQVLAQEDKKESTSGKKIEKFDIVINDKMKEEVPLEEDDSAHGDDAEVILMTDMSPEDPNDAKDELFIPRENVHERKMDTPCELKIDTPHRRPVNQRQRVKRERAPIPLSSLPPELRVFDFDGDGFLNESELGLAEFHGYEFVEKRLIPLSSLPAELRRFDLNRDGYLDENEIRIAEAHGYQFELKPPEERLIPLYALPAELKKFDFNNDGYLDEREIQAAEREGYVFQETQVEEIVPDDPSILKRMEFHGDGILRGDEINAARKQGYEFVPSPSDKAKTKNPSDQQQHKISHAVEQEEEKFDIVIM